MFSVFVFFAECCWFGFSWVLVFFEVFLLVVVSVCFVGFCAYQYFFRWLSVVCWCSSR